MTKDLGTSADADRAVVNGAGQAVSAVPASVPSAGFDWWRFVPGYWTQNYPTCRVWDTELRSLMANARHITVCPCSLVIDGVEVWISNWPYSFGWLYKSPEAARVIPTVSTRKALRAFAQRAVLKLYYTQRIEAPTGGETQSGSPCESAVLAEDAPKGGSHD